MNTPQLKLVSHHLCPYVQRAAIALDECGLEYERVYVDLADKPDWFVALSPLGKVPLLLVDEQTVLFESSVIAQYVDEIGGGELLRGDALRRAEQRAFMEFASQMIAGIGRLYNAADAKAFAQAAADLGDRFRRVENALNRGTGQNGEWFHGERFSLVDAAFAPAFRYFEVLDELTDVDFFAERPAVSRWRESLRDRESVANAVTADYADRLLAFLARRDSLVGRSAADLARARSAA